MPLMSAARASSGASRQSVSRASPATPKSRDRFARARCCDSSGTEPCESASISVTRALIDHVVERQKDRRAAARLVAPNAP